ncbi:MAG TPA: PepSY-like domain-containing protein [Segetibacter sp.]
MFKRVIFSIVILFTVASVNAQFRKIPAEVTDSFKARYATASGVSWKDKLTSFQADFKIDNKEMKSTFSTKGDWIKTETKCSLEKVPLEVKDGFKKSKYASLPVQDVLKIEGKDQLTQYKVTVKKNDFNKRYLVFSSEGQMISDNTML